VRKFIAAAGSGGLVKTLHIDTGREWRGGQQQVLYLLDGLRERGVETVLATQPGSPLYKRAKQHTHRTVELNMRGEFDYFCARHLAKIAEEEKCTVVHAHTAHAHTLAMLGSLHKTQRLVVSRRVDFVPRGGYVNRKKYLAENLTYLCVSDHISGILHDFGVPADRVCTVHSGVSSARIDDADRSASDMLRGDFGIKEGDYLIGSVAHFSEHKGHRYLIDAMPEILGKVERARLLLLGSGELEPQCRQQTSELGLEDKIIFAGFRKNIPEFMHTFNLFVLASKTEGLGTSLLDAMAARLPIVATSTGGIPEAVKDGINGFLVPPTESTTLANAIVSLAKDQELSRKFGEQGREILERDFSVDRMVDQTHEIYKKLNSET
jgi:L-malate glycosyltransferase